MKESHDCAFITERRTMTACLLMSCLSELPLAVESFVAQV
jgi:hypothetical protein